MTTNKYIAYHTLLNDQLHYIGAFFPADKCGAEYAFIKYCVREQIDLNSAAWAIKNQRDGHKMNTSIDGALNVCWAFFKK